MLLRKKGKGKAFAYSPFWRIPLLRERVRPEFSRNLHEYPQSDHEKQEPETIRQKGRKKMDTVYHIANLLFLTTNIKVLREYTTPDSRKHIETLYEGDLTNIPLNIQYKCIKSIEAQDEDLITLYVYE